VYNNACCNKYNNLLNYHTTYLEGRDPSLYLVRGTHSIIRRLYAPLMNLHPPSNRLAPFLVPTHYPPHCSAPSSQLELHNHNFTTITSQPSLHNHNSTILHHYNHTLLHLITPKHPPAHTYAHGFTYTFLLSPIAIPINRSPFTFSFYIYIPNAQQCIPEKGDI
jgi:hypothetical protein